jgi:hypothetical protein
MSLAGSAWGLSKCKARLSLIAVIGYFRAAVFEKVPMNTSASRQLSAR